ncbi:PLP-dependent transferase [Cystobasidium minutum MCA 4210]|uniref:PLP-dependent transferase n=1 Tax=Cystobasidium minutum MCA 4210 TaxID=1397322 RepID=UPI0034CFFAE2|eukprot:jgi/Rhomi1/12877/CE12876_2107
MDSAAQLPAVQDAASSTPRQNGVKAIDLSHHLSELAKARRFSPLKSFGKYMGVPGMISLAGGLPDPSYFPLESLSATLLSTETFSTSSQPEERKKHKAARSPAGWIASLFSKPQTKQVTVPKFAKEPTKETLQLSGALQYGGADGLVFLQNFLREWTTILSPPAYEDWEVLVDDGATDGWHKVLELLCNPGDPILVEAWTYPSALESGWPMGVRPVPVPIDADGLIPEGLEKVLSEWDEEKRGSKRPRVLYTVPVGQNPCGSVAQTERKKQIYAVCVKYDVIIAEDDPYYILQFPWEETEAEASTSSPAEENRQFLRSLSPSYLTFDYQGRVIRLDTFSKTVAPGCRLGWITSNARFSERLLRASETSTQQPSGFTQVVVGKILESWGMDGWIRWLRGLRAEYRERRDVTVDAFHQNFKMETVRTGEGSSRRAALTSGTSANTKARTMFVGYEKYSSTERTPLRTINLDEKFASFGMAEGRKPLISFSPPEGGMFVWVNVHISNHPSYPAQASEEERSKITKDLLNQLWIKLANNSVLVAPGWFFAGDGLRSGAPDEDQAILAEAQQTIVGALGGQPSAGIDKDMIAGIGHFRVAFSFSTHERLQEGVKRFSETVVDFFNNDK